ncbi:hypothetical protein ANCCAN_16278 [Ancylostoma caninum]|uniref:Uncharacterized protein n=1 Tax=Ancylostoma caninum TaxID=29170 RepID=A0A368G068_ANCCA|nr:hypothetical protein ANCCAN_16278 [Ancylostoma caninum]
MMASIEFEPKTCSNLSILLAAMDNQSFGPKWLILLVFAHSKKDVFYREHLWRQHSEYAAPKFYDKWIPESIGKYFW